MESLERIGAETRSLEELLESRLRAWTQRAPAHAIAHEINDAAEALEDELRNVAELRPSAAVE